MTELTVIENNIPLMDWDDRERFYEMNRTLRKMDRNKKLELCDTSIITGIWCLIISGTFFVAHHFWNIADTVNPAIGFFFFGAALTSLGWVRRRLIKHKLNWHQN